MKAYHLSFALQTSKLRIRLLVKIKIMINYKVLKQERGYVRSIRSADSHY